MSRAACSASVASVACSEPTCLCARPLRLRIKTSHSGMFCVAIMTSLNSCCGLSRCLSALAFLGVGKCCLAHPRAFVMRLAPRRQTVAVTRTIAGEHLVELFPVDRAVFPGARRLILLHAGIWNGQAEVLHLRHGGIDELLAQFVIGKALDLPFGRGVAVLAGLVGWAEHHQHRPPPAIQRTLCHRLLLFGAA